MTEVDEDYSPQTTLRWFGEPWGAGICTAQLQVIPPVGEVCTNCRQQIGVFDQGVRMPMLRDIERNFAWFHRDCFLEMLLPEEDGENPDVESEVEADSEAQAEDEPQPEVREPADG